MKPRGEPTIMADTRLKNVFEAILKYGHDEDFAPRIDDELRRQLRLPVRETSSTCWPTEFATAIRCGTRRIGPTTVA